MSGLSRYTFRKPAGEVAYQRQLRDRFTDPPPKVGLELKSARVEAIPRKLAESIILRYEWLGTMASTSLHFGLFFGRYCAGVTCVGPNGGGSAGIYRANEFGIEARELATLARGACVHWAPTGSNSKLVSWTVRLLAREVPYTKLLMAYADPEAGEIGTIYQAAGWHYVGRTKEDLNEIVSPEGRVVNIASIGSRARRTGEGFPALRDRLFEEGWHWQRSTRKAKYVAIVDRKDRELRDRIESISEPYPKRAKHSDDASVSQTEEGGSTPTRALHQSTG